MCSSLDMGKQSTEPSSRSLYIRLLSSFFENLMKIIAFRSDPPLFGGYCDR